MWRKGREKSNNSFMVQNITTIRQISTIIITTVALIKCFIILSHDVTQNDIQGEEKLPWKVFFLPESRDIAHLRVSEDDILNLLIWYG